MKLSTLSFGLFISFFGTVDAQHWDAVPLVKATELPLPNKALYLTPLSLASADFNHDGMKDLAVGYQSPAGGKISLALGSLTSELAIRKSEKKSYFNAAFMTVENERKTTLAADFLVAGDFNADGNNDLISAAKHAHYFEFHPGRGDGTFGLMERTYLGGEISQLVAGEVNRADGLMDLVVSTRRGDRYELLVYQGPKGAIGHAPEGVRISLTPVALALGEFDGRPGLDVAYGASYQIGIVHGRNRRLSTSAALAPAPLTTSTMDLASPVISLAGGEWAHGQTDRLELAVLTADGHLQLFQLTSDAQKFSSTQWTSLSTGVLDLSGDDPLASVEQMNFTGPHLWLTGSVDTQVFHVSHPLNSQSMQVSSLGRPGVNLQAILPGRRQTNTQRDLLAIEKTSGDVVLVSPKGLAPIVVDVEVDPQPIVIGDGCTLREAVINANDDAQTHVDCAAGVGADTINFAIDGGGSAASIALADELPALSGTVTIDGTTQCATPPCVQLDGGAIALNGATQSDGLNLAGSSSVIRGMIISGFPLEGIRVGGTGGHVIEGNHIGLDLSGTAADGVGRTGVVVQSPDNLVGGRTPASRNVISGNGGTAISVINFGTGTDATRNRLEGNYLGTDPSGISAIGNLGVGVFIGDAAGNVVGGTETGAGNIISANLRGIVIDNFLDAATFTTENNLVQGNRIGLNSAGEPLGNTQEGVIVFDSRNNTIGGTTVGARNVISNNTRGIWVWPTELIDTTGNIIQGNYVGTDLTGTIAQANGQALALQNTTDTLVGGTVPNAGNVLSASAAAGIQIQSNGDAPSENNTVQGNLIGTNATGDAALGNAFQGIFMNATSGNTIGGSDPRAGNVISDNGFNGISLEQANGNIIEGNFIGTDLSGGNPLPNRAMLGIVVNESSDNLIVRNRIGGNGGTAIQIRVGENNQLSENAIAGSFTNGIDLGQDGVTANDNGDSDTGPNNLQNFPVLDSLTNGNQISGTLNSAANASFAIEFFANPDCTFVEGARFLGSTSVTTDGNGDAVIAATLATAAGSATGLTATATDETGNTSVFSACLTFTASTEIFSDGFEED